MASTPLFLYCNFLEDHIQTGRMVYTPDVSSDRGIFDNVACITNS